MEETTQEASKSALDSITANPNVFDGQLWAIALTELIERNKDNPHFKLDRDLLTVWFSNAIMAGYDHAKKELREDTYNG